MKKKKNLGNLITKNKKAYFDYEVVDSWESGIELKGHETKSIRNGHVNLKGSYVVEINRELYIKGMNVSALASLPNKSSIDTQRERKIFLKRKTIDYLISKKKEAGYSVIALELYFSQSLIKAKIGLVKGKKSYQKKQILKERSMRKEADIAMKKVF